MILHLKIESNLEMVIENVDLVRFCDPPLTEQSRPSLSPIFKDLRVVVWKFGGRHHLVHRL